VLTLSVVAQHGLIGPIQSPLDLSYLADNVMLFRIFEVAGSVRLALSVLKRRSGAHERTIRELRLSTDGLSLSDPLTGLHGVLTGVPDLDPSLSGSVPELP
jgi:circadian clock protein KaiC